MSRDIARKYAVAIFEQAKQQNLLLKTEQDFATLLSLMETHSLLKTYLREPHIPLLQKKYALGEILKKVGVSELFQTSVYLLVDRKRIFMLPLIFQQYMQLRHEADDQVVGELVTSEALDPTVQSSLFAMFERKLHKKIIWSKTVDPSILAGFRVKINHTIYDASLQSQLRNLEKEITH